VSAAALALLLLLPASADEAAARAAVERLGQAGLRRDVEALGRLYAPGYFHTNPNGSVMTLEETLASYRAPTDVRFDSSERDEERAVVRGGVAVVSNRTTLHGWRGETPFTSRFRVTYVLVKEESGWKVLNSHSSLLGER